MPAMHDPKATLQSAGARPPGRWRLVRRILLGVLVLLVAFAAYQYFFVFRLSMRNPAR